MRETFMPVMMAVNGASARHLTRWQWFDNDPLVVRLQITAPAGIMQVEVSREVLVSTVVDGNRRAGVDGGSIVAELPDMTAIPQTWLIMSALLGEWDQEGEILQLHVTTVTGVHMHLFVPALWLAPFLEKTTQDVPDGKEVYDVDLLLKQIFEEAERKKL